MSINVATILSTNGQECPNAVTEPTSSNTPTTLQRKPYVPEGSQKRNLSLDSTPSPTSAINCEKRQRQSSLVFDEISVLAPARMNEPEPEPTLASIVALLQLTAKVSDLDRLASKDDLIKLQATVSSQALEIQQLRQTMTAQSTRLQNLEDSLGGRTAATLNRNRIQPDVDLTRPSQFGGPRVMNSRLDERRRNLVFEGIPAVSSSEMEAFILQVCSALGIIAYPCDIDTITPMKRRDPASKRPPPVLVTFEQLHVRSGLLRQKSKLIDFPKFATVFINPDEPIEVRRNKATFRKIAFKARQDGKSTVIRNEWIQIEDDVYYVPDLDKIPDKYKPTAPTKVSESMETGDQVPKPNPEINGAIGGARPKIPSKPITKAKTFSRVKIKLTEAGVTFSGPSAFLSHMFNCEFVLDDTPYTSVEQGYHHLHARQEDELELAEAIMEMYYAHDIKDAAKILQDSDEWNEMSPGVLRKLNRAKYDQNPDLKAKLIETAPHLIVEATVDARWGGGCPFGSDIYEQGQVPGRNVAGVQLTEQRDSYIEEDK